MSNLQILDLVIETVSELEGPDFILRSQDIAIYLKKWLSITARIHTLSIWDKKKKKSGQQIEIHSEVFIPYPQK